MTSGKKFLADMGITPQKPEYIVPILDDAKKNKWSAAFLLELYSEIRNAELKNEVESLKAIVDDLRMKWSKEY